MSEAVLPPPELRHSFTGRVRNFNLPPTASNCMMPVYEAVTNALYAIQERFPETWADDGKITIDVLRTEPSDGDAHSPVIGFVITDNGIGLDDALFGHFRELDTEYRAEKKGRGIGRLSWIKVFNTAEVSSVFERNGEKVARSFCFRLSNERPFDAYSEGASETNAATGTQVKLNNFRDAYNAKFKAPSKTTYSGAPGDNPVIQIRKYIESLLTKTCYSYDGDRITDINKGTPFLCFLIAEPSQQLYELLRQHQIHKPTPDGDGRFAYLEDLNAYFEFIPYDQVLKNAALRNEAFFRKLKLERVSAHTRTP